MAARTREEEPVATSQPMQIGATGLGRMGANIRRNATAGKRQRTADAETAPLDHPEFYQYDIDTAAVAELWRRGSVVGSWLLDLTGAALPASPDLADLSGRVA